MTRPHQDQWPPSDHKYRRSEVNGFVGSGDAVWHRAAHEVLRWKLKTQSGFVVDSLGPVSPGEHVVVTARVLGVTVVEPVEVVDVVQEPGRCGFSYRTLPGHPVDGEEAFFVYRRGDEVHLTIRSLTRAAPRQPWRLLFPLILIAQRIVQRRYLRALE
ncbi:DUF1990 family protein [Pseudarthrobacter sp. W1I19]|uniref:DUF1990 family protein n=1 Tax=Pseudarthrobacter sp. W1I19 TaxID=3042288 RepID=UPI0027D77942|nr:DUF1990 family protein [Pseudarthrobacter sp. W1I19]